MSITKESFVATVDNRSGDRLFWSGASSNGSDAPDVYGLSLGSAKRSMVLEFIRSGDMFYHVRFLGYYNDEEKAPVTSPLSQASAKSKADVEPAVDKAAESTQAESSPKPPGSRLQIDSNRPWINVYKGGLVQHVRPAGVMLLRTGDPDELDAALTVANVDTGYWGLAVGGYGELLLHLGDFLVMYREDSILGEVTPAELKFKLIGTYNPDGTIKFIV